jgi:hypothetical protein
MLSDADIERARYHLGYIEVTVASSFAFGILASTQPMFMFESAIKRVMPNAEPRVISILDTMDEIECILRRASKELSLRRADGLEINLQQPDDVEREYVRWASRLADMLGVTPYPFSERFRVLARGGLSGGAGNFRISR